MKSRRSGLGIWIAGAAACAVATTSTRARADEPIINAKAVETSTMVVRPYVFPTVDAQSAPWESAIVGGIAGFATDRAQQEVVQWFVDTMFSKICEDPRAKDFFKNSCQLARLVNQGTIPSRTAVVTALRADMDVVPIALMNHLIGGTAFRWMTVAVNLLQGIRAGNNPTAMIAGLPDNEALRSLCKLQTSSDPEMAGSGKVACAFIAAGLAVRVHVEAPTATPDDFVVALKARLVAAGISVTVSDGKLTLLLELVKSAVKTLKRELTDLQTAMTVQKEADALARASRVARATVDAIDSLARGLEIAVPEYFRPAADAAASFASGQYPEGLLAVSRAVDALTDDQRKAMPAAVTRYLPLAIDLSSAKTSEDAQTALEAAAAPIGGWRLKRGQGMASIGALVGVHAGGEWGFQGSSLKESAGILGVFAPVGFDLSTPIYDSSTFGVFISLIDVGTLVSTRLAGSQDADVKEVERTNAAGFAEVLAPGAYLRLGLGRSPFTVAGGASYLPRLREVTLDDGSSDVLHGLRLQIALTADVVFFPL